MSKFSHWAFGPAHPGRALFLSIAWLALLGTAITMAAKFVSPVAFLAVPFCAVPLIYGGRK